MSPMQEITVHMRAVTRLKCQTSTCAYTCKHKHISRYTDEPLHLNPQIARQCWLKTLVIDMLQNLPQQRKVSCWVFSS